MDEIIFKKLSGTSYTDLNSATLGEAATTNTNVIYPGSATSKATITSGDVFTPDLLRKAKAAAVTGIFGGSTAWRVRPMMVNGLPLFGCILHPWQVYQLQGNSDWLNAVQNALPRSSENPVFSGALGLWNGIVLYEHDLVVRGSDAGSSSNVPYADALFFGLQAGLWAEAQPAPNWVEKGFDYEDQWGVATGMTFGFDKTTFNSVDFAVIKIQTAAQDPTA